MRCALALPLLLWACNTRIEHGLSERDANEVVTALSARSIRGQKVLEPGKTPRFSIEVKDGQAETALRTLQELGLPRQRESGLGEVFGKHSFVPSPGEERALLSTAVAAELSQTLEAIDGVVSA